MADITDKANQWKQDRKNRRFKINKQVEVSLPTKAGPGYSLIDEIKKLPYYKDSHVMSRNEPRATAFLEEHTDTSGSSKIRPGQLILFKYFEPKTKEELEYYDARPCTIFFNVIKTDQGKRVLGFNIHYYPPRMRYQIMSTIFDIYKPIYSKYFENGTKSTVEAFDYKYLIDSLEKAGLGFGVRMYIPDLIKDIHHIPPQMWHVAVFTEGWFKKQTREAIMKYWRQWRKKH